MGGWGLPISPRERHQRRPRGHGCRPARGARRWYDRGVVPRRRHAAHPSVATPPSILTATRLPIECQAPQCPRESRGRTGGRTDWRRRSFARAGGAGIRPCAREQGSEVYSNRRRGDTWLSHAGSIALWAPPVTECFVRRFSGSPIGKESSDSSETMDWPGDSPAVSWPAKPLMKHSPRFVP